MEDAKRFAKEKLDLTPEDVINYLQKHRPRVILNAVAFALQFLTVWFFMTGHDWKKRFGLVKLWLLLWIIVLMAIFEMLRFSDFLLKKHGLLHHLGGSEGNDGGSGHTTKSSSSLGSPGSQPGGPSKTPSSPALKKSSSLSSQKKNK